MLTLISFKICCCSLVVNPLTLKFGRILENVVAYIFVLCGYTALPRNFKANFKVSIIYDGIVISVIWVASCYIKKGMLYLCVLT